MSDKSNLYPVLLAAFQAGVNSTTTNYNAEDYPTAASLIECLDNFEAWLEEDQPELYATICRDERRDARLGDPDE